MRHPLFGLVASFGLVIPACVPMRNRAPSEESNATSSQAPTPREANGAQVKDDHEPRADDHGTESSGESREGLPAIGSFFGRYFRPQDDYELDALDRSGPPRGKKPKCENDALVTYRGKVVRYAPAASVHRAFAPRLARFESVVSEVAIAVYGRAPTTLHHAGGYSCRTSWRGRMSEHAFGNALDVAGFTFPAISKNDLARARERGLELGAAQRRSFRVDVGTTWRPNANPDAKRFYALLLERVRAEEAMFRGVIGPPDPAHTTHLHFDAGPWSFGRYAPPG